MDANKGVSCVSRPRVWLLNVHRDRDRSLQLLILNEEFLVNASHQLALITSLPFVHTARRTFSDLRVGIITRLVIHGIQPTETSPTIHTFWLLRDGNKEKSELRKHHKTPR